MLVQPTFSSEAASHWPIFTTSGRCFAAPEMEGMATASASLAIRLCLLESICAATLLIAAAAIIAGMLCGVER